MNSLFTIGDREVLLNLRNQIYLILERSLVRNSEIDKSAWLTTDSDKHTVVVAGGWFASKLQDTIPKDIDIFILCGGPYPEEFQRYANAVRNEAKLRGVNLDESTAVEYAREKIWAVYTQRSQRFEDRMRGTNIQYIFSKYSDRKKLLADFDYLHTTISYNLGNHKLYTTYNAYDAAKNRKLIVNHQPQDWRRHKFLSRGYIEVKDGVGRKSAEYTGDYSGDMPWYHGNAEPISPRRKFHESVRDGLKQAFGKLEE